MYFFATPVSGRDNQSCGIEPGKPLTNHYGPYDYTNPRHADRFPVVLKRHFTDDIRRLIAHNAHGDLDYTLRAIPNHLPALESMARLQLRWKASQITNDDVYTAECYFKRAIYFSPKDINAKHLYAVYLHQSKSHKSAESIYLQVLKADSSNIEVHYNFGLLLLELGKIDTAKDHAKIAYEGNFPLQGLKKKLITLGAWN